MISMDVHSRITRLILPIACLIALAGVVAGCSHNEGAAEGGTNTIKAVNNTGTQRHKMTGKVISVDKSGKTAQIANDNIPGFMGPMTMGYPVYNGADLDRMSPGDTISADIVQTPNGFYLENITVTQKGTGTAPAGQPSSELHIPAVGDTVPNFALTNQDGQRIHLRDFRGDVLMVTFVYTQCPFPNFCPLVSKNFANIYASARKDPALSKVRLLTISFDPQHDTPAVLKKYGESFHAITGGAPFKSWEFATAKPADMQKIANFFGVSYSVQQGVLVHSLSTSVITPDGKIYKWYDDNSWSSSDLMKDASEALVQDVPVNAPTTASLRIPARSSGPSQAN